METLEEKASTNQVEKLAKETTRKGISESYLILLPPYKYDEVGVMIRDIFQNFQGFQLLRLIHSIRTISALMIR